MPGKYKITITVQNILALGPMIIFAIYPKSNNCVRVKGFSLINFSSNQSSLSEVQLLKLPASFNFFSALASDSASTTKRADIRDKVPIKREKTVARLTPDIRKTGGIIRGPEPIMQFMTVAIVADCF